MSKLVYVEEVHRNDIICAAIQKEVPCTIAHRDDTGWATFKSRFCRGDQNGQGLMIDTSAETIADAARRLQVGEKVGVTFRRGHKKCMFASVVLRSANRVAEATNGLEIRWPNMLQELQRRVYHRAVPHGKRILVRMWKGGVAARASADASSCGIMTGFMEDISAGGMRVVSTEANPETFVTNESVGCSFAPRQRGEPLVLDAVFRHVQLTDRGAAMIGLQFVGLEATEAGRNTLAELARLVAEYQRAQARRERLQLQTHRHRR
jgi:hypothetical protein